MSGGARSTRTAASVSEFGSSRVELNTKGRYAVMAMADLAKHGAGSAVPLSAIADRQQISLAYLEQLFAKLRRAGLVESERGRSGGYRLALPARDVSVRAIMSAVEEDVRMTRCQGEEALPCVLGRRCLTHGLWDALGDQIAIFLDSVSLQDVLDGVPRPSRFPIPAAPAKAATLMREGP
jgi:Rrf2 family protein